MSTKQKGRDYSTILIWAAAIVVVVRYAAAFVASDVGQIEGPLSEWITRLMGLSGIGMGLLTVLGQTYTFDGWRRSLPKSGHKWGWRFSLLTFFVFALIVTDIMILVPFTVSRVEHKSMAEVLERGELWWWSILVNAAPALLIAGVALGNQVVTVTQSAGTQNSANDANGSANGSREHARRYSSLSESEKYYIINTNSSAVAKELRVTPRAVQKWRKLIQEEIAQGKL